MEMQKAKKPRFVPVIGTNVVTGETVRFPSVKEACTWLGVHSAQISNALVMGHSVHGYRWEKEENNNGNV